LAKDNCDCEQDMTWKNQQMEMKNKGVPEQDGKGKWSRETWRVRVDHAYHYVVLQKAWSPHQNWNCEPIEGRSQWQSRLKAGHALPIFNHCLKFLEEVHKAMRCNKY
jgi:hypothetical protein